MHLDLYSLPILRIPVSFSYCTDSDPHNVNVCVVSDFKKNNHKTFIFGMIALDYLQILVSFQYVNVIL